MNKEFRFLPLIILGFLLSVYVGIEIGKVLFEGDSYGELKPATLGMTLGAMYNYILIVIYLERNTNE